MMWRKFCGIVFSLLIWVCMPSTALRGMAFGEADNLLLPQRQRGERQDRILKERLNTVLPDLMRETSIDCWLIICREYNEDPVFWSLMPAQTFSARRLTMLAFFANAEGKVDCCSVSPYDIGGIYTGVWQKDKEEQWAALVRLIGEKNPARIAVNRSRHYAHADGLSAFLEKELSTHLPPEYAQRLVDGETLCVRWLETRLPSEEIHMMALVAFTRTLIQQAFSAQNITPGKTTVSDLQWWMKSEMDRAGVHPWFFPHVDRKGRMDDAVANDGLILRGDLLHCDVGCVYMGLCSDIQELAYVCLAGETDVPEALNKGLAAANSFQNLVMAELVVGRTGNQILAASLKAAQNMGLEGACLYSHPLGFHGHAAGASIGMWDNQRGLPGTGDWPVFPHTAYALELNVTRTVPGWAGLVRFGLEQDILVSEKMGRYINGRQTAFHVIR